jgi:hypothetical protein
MTIAPESAGAAAGQHQKCKAEPGARQRDRADCGAIEPIHQCASDQLSGYSGDAGKACYPCRGFAREAPFAQDRHQMNNHGQPEGHHDEGGERELEKGWVPEGLSDRHPAVSCREFLARRCAGGFDALILQEEECQEQGRQAPCKAKPEPGLAPPKVGD